MRAFVQTAIDRFEERDLPAPRAGPGEVVLRVTAALTCGTDIKLLKRGHSAIGLPAEVPARGAINKALVEERVDAVTAPNDADAFW